jgi:hypothetical protein
MTVSDLNNSAVNDKMPDVTVAGTAPKADPKSGSAAQAEKRDGSPAPKVDLTPGGVSRFLNGISTSSCGEIDTLIGDLRVLREKLVGDGDRIERDLVEFATLNQSVIKLTEVVMDSVTHVKAPGRRR